MTGTIEFGNIGPVSLAVRSVGIVSLTSNLSILDAVHLDVHVIGLEGISGTCLSKERECFHDIIRFSFPSLIAEYTQIFYFEFMLPKSHSVTTSNNSSSDLKQGFHYFVKYFIYAVVTTVDCTSLCENRQDIIVITEPSRDEIPIKCVGYAPPQPLQIYFLRKKCWTGELKVGLRMENCILCTGNSFQFNYTIANASQARIWCIDVLIVEQVLFDGAKVGNDIVCFKQRLFPFQLPDNVSPYSSTNQLRVNSSLSWRKQMMASLEDTENGNIFTGTLGTNANPSVNGLHLQIKHTLHFKILTWLGYNNVELTLPLFLISLQKSGSPLQLSPRSSTSGNTDILPSVLESAVPLEVALFAQGEVSVQQLLKFMVSDKFDPVQVFITWADHTSCIVMQTSANAVEEKEDGNIVEKLIPHELGRLFATVKKCPLQQLELALAVLGRRSSWYCDDIIAVYPALHEMCKIDILRRIAACCRDGDDKQENRWFVRQTVTDLNYCYIEEFFNTTVNVPPQASIAEQQS